MRVFLDTNVILEFFIEREDVRTAAQLFNRLKDEKAEMYMSVGSFYTMLFLIDKYLRKELGLTGEVRIATLRSLAVKIVKAISVVEHDNESLLRGVEDVQFKDIEDSCQYQAAVAAGCDFIITYNVKDYPYTLLPVYSPSDFLHHGSVEPQSL